MINKTPSENPFLNNQHFPSFEQFHVEHIKPALEQVIEENTKAINELIQSTEKPTWENFIQPIEILDNRFEKVWGPVGHLDAVNNSDDWHDAYTNALEKVTQYRTELGQNSELYRKYLQISESDAFAHYDKSQQTVINNALRNFKLSGIALSGDKQATFKNLSQKLSKASSQFGNNVLKSTQSWFVEIDDESELAGLPDTAKALLKQLAQQKNKDGWCVTLDFPSYLAVMTHSEKPELREKVYKAFSTRASEQFDYPEFDNSGLIDEIRRDRHKLAQLLDFDNYAEYSLATKMATDNQQVLEFLKDLAKKSKPQAALELNQLKEFAKTKLGIDVLQPWDITYASEQYKKATLSLSQETLRPYFPVDKVIEGLFSLTHTLFGITIKPKSGICVWHEDVKFYELTDEQNEVIGHFYLDLYARANKRGGAWMNSAVSRWVTPNQKLQTPVAYLVCNFTPPIEGKTACLTHDEVTTLFHEFGHGIHHLLTKMDKIDVSGISGVPWDAVELPSQFMENFCWEREGIDAISGHIETGESLPDDLLSALKKGRGFQSAMMMLRQVEFALTDFEMHAYYDEQNPEPVQALCNRIRKQVAVVIPPEYNRFMHSFSHIFAGGYAAGYYSYKWAEVLSADAFSLFEEQGILNSDVGHKFKNTILSAGGSEDPMILFKAFRGREPQIDALLRHSGIQ